MEWLGRYALTRVTLVGQADERDGLVVRILGVKSPPERVS